MHIDFRTGKRPRSLATLQAHSISMREHFGSSRDASGFHLPPKLAAYEPTLKDLTYGSWLNAEILKKMGAPASKKGCVWIEGEPSDRKFCCAVVRPGYSWCEDHLPQVYVVKKKDAE